MQAGCMWRNYPTDKKVLMLRGSTSYQHWFDLLNLLGSLSLLVYKE